MAADHEPKQKDMFRGETPPSGGSSEDGFGQQLPVDRRKRRFRLDDPQEDDDGNWNRYVELQSPNPLELGGRKPDTKRVLRETVRGPLNNSMAGGEPVTPEYDDPQIGVHDGVQHRRSRKYRKETRVKRGISLDD